MTRGTKTNKHDVVKNFAHGACIVFIKRYLIQATAIVTVNRTTTQFKWASALGTRVAVNDTYDDENDCLSKEYSGVHNPR